MATLVTGSSGFLGQFLIPHLRSLSPEEPILGCALTAPKDTIVPTEIVDLTDKTRVLEIIQKVKPKKVFHLAGIAKVSAEIPFESYFFQNTLTTQYLLDAIATLNSPVDFFLTSSVHVYGNQTEIVNERSEAKPEGSYGFTKYLAEETLKNIVLKHPKIRGVVGRLYSCIGPKQPDGFVTSDICRKIKDLKKSGGKTLEVGPTDSYRRFTDARDVIKTFPILLNSTQNSRFEIFNIAPSTETQISSMIQLLLKLERLEANVVSKATQSNSFKGLRIDTTKMEQYVPQTVFRPLELTLKDVLDTTPC